MHIGQSTLLCYCDSEVGLREEIGVDIRDLWGDERLVKQVRERHERLVGVVNGERGEQKPLRQQTPLARRKVPYGEGEGSGKRLLGDVEG